MKMNQNKTGLFVVLVAGACVLVSLYCPSFGRFEISAETFSSYCQSRLSEGKKLVTREGTEITDLSGNQIILVDNFNYVVRTQTVVEQIQHYANLGAVERRFCCSI